MPRSLFAVALWLGTIAGPVDAASPAPPVPLLWKACDADNCLYLLGSFHFLAPSDYPLSAEVEAAFVDAERLVFEIPPREMDSPVLRRRIQAAGVRRDGRLSDDLTPSQNAVLAAWLGGNAAVLVERGLDPADFQSLRPWYAGLLVTLIGLDEAGMKAQWGLDRHFSERAARAGKPVSGLESGASQIALLSAMPPDEQRQMLMEALDSAAGGDMELQALHDAWRRGDARSLLEGTALELQKEYPRFYRSVNVDRNDAWLPRLEQRLKAQGTDDHLIVVGAMHLLGSDGVVEKLRARGYHVKRICSSCAAGPDETPD